MCDTFVALPTATKNNKVILGKSADCQINEALALVRFPRQEHIPGEAIRTTHRVIPQADTTYEVILGKSFWTWGAEIGFNEFGVAIGNEAVFTTLQDEEKSEGLMTIDMLRIGLERGKTAQEAVQAIVAILEEFGQGGNCELAGNSHFDGSYLIADTSEAWILETAGREWAAQKVREPIASISNLLTIGDDWDMSSLKARVHWADTYSIQEMISRVGSRERKACSYNGLNAHIGEITVRTAFDVLRLHGDDYDPARDAVHRAVCIHAGPQEDRQWQATGAMVAESSADGVMAWFTATASNCLSIFKPVFPGVELPDMGPPPNEHYNPQAMWWKHELLHRRAMADFENVRQEIRKDFDALEDAFIAEAASVLKGSAGEKKAFMDDCFQRAGAATDQWIERLKSRKDLCFEDEAYRDMWRKYNRQAGLRALVG